MRQIQLAQQLYMESAHAALERGCWTTGEVLEGPDTQVLGNWITRLAECGKAGFLQGCPAGHGRVRAVTKCCQTAPCPRHQRRRSDEWVTRASRLWHSCPPTATRSWKLVTLNWRPSGHGVHADIVQALRVRKLAMRWIAKHFAVGGDFAAFGAVELGDGQCRPCKIAGTPCAHNAGAPENVHVHALVYTDFLPRPQLQTWLRSQDCTVAGCHHPADDRCAPCRAARASCAHPDGARTRCDGSWSVDVRRVRDEKGLREGLKYASKPVLLAYEPHRGVSMPELLHVEKALRFYLALRGRHRVESYGLARKRAPEDEAEAEDVEPGDDAAHCPTCKATLRPLVGWLWCRATHRMHRVPAAVVRNGFSA